MIIAVNLGQLASRRDAKRRLQQSVEAAVEVARKQPAVRHVLIVSAHEGQPGLHVEGLMSSMLTRAHAALERRNARDVEFTSLDVSECNDPELLADRIVERGASLSQTHGVVVLDWADIAGQSIAAAAREIYS
ncbi:hypothetical protein [uncultured Microbacterium sp.]|uniref:hypothetical protein n=1 Tax=uncultured Microbacterium sp. TaxID=191216 RepID=UPI00260E59BD|nr:hypothetical protein [uncultured Microbacterium sp.]